MTGKGQLSRHVDSCSECGIEGVPSVARREARVKIDHLTPPLRGTRLPGAAEDGSGRGGERFSV